MPIRCLCIVLEMIVSCHLAYLDGGLGFKGQYDQITYGDLMCERPDLTGPVPDRIRLCVGVPISQRRNEHLPIRQVGYVQLKIIPRNVDSLVLYELLFVLTV